MDDKPSLGIYYGAIKNTQGKLEITKANQQSLYVKISWQNASDNYNFLFKTDSVDRFYMPVIQGSTGSVFLALPDNTMKWTIHPFINHTEMPLQDVESVGVGKPIHEAIFDDGSTSITISIEEDTGLPIE